MTKKKLNKNLSESKNQIFWLFNFIPLIRIKHTVKVIPQGKVNILRFRKRYWLLCFIPLFATERDWEE